MGTVERQRPYSLRLEPELLEWVKGRAKNAGRSLNAEMCRLLQEVMDKATNGVIPAESLSAERQLGRSGIRLYTLAEVYIDAMKFHQKSGADGLLLQLDEHGKPDAFDVNVFPCCAGCIHFSLEDMIGDGAGNKNDRDFGTCFRYPQPVRVEVQGRCGEYLGEPILSEQVLEKLGSIDAVRV